MNNRKLQLLSWVVSNFDKWPAPMDANPDGEDPIVISAEWVCIPSISCQPVLKCRMGGGFVTALDWFYHKRRNPHGGPGRGQGRKPAMPGQPLKLRSVRLTDKQWEMLKRVGVNALRAWLDGETR